MSEKVKVTNCVIRLYSPFGRRPSHHLYGDIASLEVDLGRIEFADFDRCFTEKVYGAQDFQEIEGGCKRYFGLSHDFEETKKALVDRLYEIGFELEWRVNNG